MSCGLGGDCAEPGCLGRGLHVESVGSTHPPGSLEVGAMTPPAFMAACVVPNAAQCGPQYGPRTHNFLPCQHSLFLFFGSSLIGIIEMYMHAFCYDRDDHPQSGCERCRSFEAKGYQVCSGEDLNACTFDVSLSRCF